MPENTPPLPTDNVTDQDVDTAGTEADQESAAPNGRRDGALTGDHAPATASQGHGRSPVAPATMHRAEDDAAARAGSRDFSEQPDRATGEPPSRSGD